MSQFLTYGDREALVYDAQRLSYADLASQIPAMAARLRGHGVRPGSVIAILAGNKPETIILQLAAHRLGCRTVWVAGYAPIRLQTDYLERAGADVFVYDTTRFSAAAKELLTQGEPGKVLCLGPGGTGPDLLAGLADDAVAASDFSDVRSEPGSLFYTSGTTGRPKLVHHRQSFFQALQAIGAAWLAAGLPSLRHLAYTGFAHVSGQMTNLLMLFTGGTVVLRDQFDIPEFFDLIERERITSTLLIPGQLYDVLDHPGLAGANTSSLLLLNVGGAPAAPARLRQAIGRFGPVLRLVYGLSEAAFVTDQRGLTIDEEHPERLASCGQPFADSRVEIRDDDGKPCPRGTVGEVWVAGSLVMAGYWDEPELTSQVLVDGWLRTGDLGYLDPDGFLFLVDRSKDLIITGFGAAHVYTRQVEDVLASHPLVRSAAVIGVPDAELGETVRAFVVVAPGAEVTADELRALVTAELGASHAPHVVEVVDTLPLTGMGKVDKNALRAAAP